MDIGLFLIYAAFMAYLIVYASVIVHTMIKNRNRNPAHEGLSAHRVQEEKEWYARNRGRIRALYIYRATFAVLIIVILASFSPIISFNPQIAIPIIAALFVVMCASFIYASRAG